MRIGLIVSPWIAPQVLGAIPKTCQVVGVGTAEVTPGIEATLSAVQQVYGYPCLRLKRTTLKEQLREWIEGQRADIVLVVTFAHRIPAAVLSIPPLGFLNFHPGQLPAFRGADPIFWQIRQRVGLGGWTVHRMEADFDTGPILDTYYTPIPPTDTYGHQVGRLKELVKTAVHTTTIKAASGRLLFRPQEAAGAAYYGKVREADLGVDWHDDPEAIGALVRAANPEYRGAIATFRGKRCFIQECRVESPPHPHPPVAPGTVVDRRALDGTPGLWVAGGDGRLVGLEVLSLDEGTYSGSRLLEVFAVQPGECFSGPSLQRV